MAGAVEKMDYIFNFSSKDGSDEPCSGRQLGTGAAFTTRGPREHLGTPLATGISGWGRHKNEELELGVGAGESNAKAAWVQPSAGEQTGWPCVAARLA